MEKALLPLLLVSSLVLIIILQFGFIFLLLALLPSIVAYFTDGLRGKPAFKTVLACNMAATLPSLIPMLEAGVKLKHYDIFSTLISPNTWLLVYSGAGAGWCLIYLCRYIARFAIMMFYEYNIAMLESQQKRLVEEWGQQIKQPPGMSPKR
jgi:hypothetical protein